MASGKEYLMYIMEQLSELSEIEYRAMMGEYIIYYRGKIAGGICDDRFLVKPVEAAKKLMPDAPMEKPYEGAKEMLLVQNVESREFLKKLFETMYDELPERKVRKTRRKNDK
ncbi:MAG: TfoX/Sxy family protein [Porcipelethomonas sp.]